MVAGLNNLVRLQKPQAKAAAEMLARAFQDDPLIIYYFPDTSQRQKKSSHLFDFWIRYALAYGEVYAISPNLEGVAVWYPSEKAHLTLGGMIMNGGLSLYAKLGRKVILRRRPLIDYTSSIRERYVPFRHWHLEVLGVDPRLQGKGYAGILVKPMLARLDQKGLPCFLETQNEKNVPIYQHFGFKVVADVIIPSAGIRHWAMLREKSS